jgi:hypothetical protein
MTTSTIQTATGADQDHLIAVIVLAFSTDPVARWSSRLLINISENFPSL